MATRKQTDAARKATAKKNAPAKGGPPLYAWNGGAKTHTVSQADHAMHVQDPLTKDPLYASAKQQATSYYAPQQNALNTLQTSAPVWYQNYINQATAAQAASQKYAAPVLGQAQSFATNIATPAAGLDPNSAEYQKSQQAGKGLGALAQLGVQNLQANQTATTDYFGGQQANAAAALPGALASYATQQGQLGSQVQGKTQELYQGLKQAAVNEDIARQTLLGNQANMAADNTQAAANAVQTAKDKKAARVVSRKNTTDRITATTNTQATAQAKADAKQAEKDAAAQQKKTAAIQKAVGKAKVKVQDVADAWGRGGTMPAPTAQNPNATRPATREELRKLLGGKYGAQYVSIMERVRKGQAITQQQIDYLHAQDPDFRVPSVWKNGKQSSKPTPAEKPVTTTGGKTYRP